MIGRDLYDAEDAAEQLRERADAASDAADAAYQRGLDEFEPSGDVEVGAARYGHPRLAGAYRDGWRRAARGDA